MFDSSKIQPHIAFTDLREWMAEAEKLKSEYGAHEAEIANLRTKLNEQTDTSLKRFQEIEQLRGEVAKLSLRLNERSGLADIARTELEASREQINSLHRDVSEKAEKISQLEHRIHDQTDFLANIQREMDAKAMEVRHLNAELERQVIAFDTYQKSQSDLQQRYAKSQIRVQELQANITMFEQNLRKISGSPAYKVFSALGVFTKPK